MHLEELVVNIINLLVPLIEACGAAIIVIGAIRALWQFARNRLVIDLSCGSDLRVGLAEYLVLAEPGCILNIRGYIEKQGLPLKVLPLAQVLAAQSGAVGKEAAS